MGGLLYKDFVAVKGKRLVWSFVILTVIFCALRMAFPGTSDIPFFMVEDNAGETVNMLDFFFGMMEGSFLIGVISMINNMQGNILAYDGKSRIHGYLFSMPFQRKGYVASKYLFIAIAIYVGFSCYCIWHVISVAFMRPGRFADVSQILMAFALPLMCLLLCVSAVEMPMYFLLGKAKSTMIRVCFWMLVAFFAIGYLLFGDMKVLSSWDFGVLIRWLEAHNFELVLLSVLSPMISLGLYYVSYRITVHCYERKEEFDED